MPIYEYRCRDCGATTSVFFRSISAGEAGANCGSCDSAATERLISRTHVRRGLEARIDDYDAGRALSGLEGEDRGSFARWARRMSDDLGEDVGSHFLDLAERAEAGDDPVERVEPAHTLERELLKRKGVKFGLKGEDEGGDSAHDWTQALAD